MNDMLTEQHGGQSGGHFGINKTLDKSGKGTAGSRQETMFRSGAGSVTPMQPVTAPFEKKAIDIVGPFPRNDQGNRYLLIAMDSFQVAGSLCHFQRRSFDGG
jgi:hypothetical protein